MNSPFLNDFDFFKSYKLNENGILSLIKSNPEKEDSLSKMKAFLINMLKKNLEKSFIIDFNEELLIKGKSYSVGTVREWQGKKYKKIRQGKWLRLYEKSDEKGINIAIAKTIKKIESAKTVNELAEIVYENKKRFLEGEKTSPIVKNLLNRAKGRRETFEIKKEEKENTMADILNKTGYWNGKIYGNEKYGYRVYIDNKETKISNEQKNELLKYKQRQTEKANQEKEKQQAIKDYQYTKDRAIENILNTIEDDIALDTINNIYKEEKEYSKRNPRILDLVKYNNKTPEENFEMVWQEAKSKFEAKQKAIQEFESKQTSEDKNIADKLIKLGGKLWESYGKHKIYFNGYKAAALFGLDTSQYKTGNISSATLDGEKISNSKANKLINSFDKFHYDLDSKKFAWSQYSDKENSEKLVQILNRRIK
jgi:hypothetical protein